MARPARRSWIAALACMLAATLVAQPNAIAKDGSLDVDVELVLAVDISYSMDPDEQRLQREGYIQALVSPQFLNALKSGPYGRIAVAYLQWASQMDQDVLLPWTVIDGPESAQRVAERLTEAPYRRAQRTSISGAIDSSMKLFEGNGMNGLRRVIDVSGDGTNNSGRPVALAREEAVNQGVIINGLPLLVRPSSWGFNDIANLDEYYEDCVIGGVGAFSIPIRDRTQFIEATRTKLVQEIAMAPPPARLLWGEPLIQKAQQREPRVNCMVGESLWRNRWGN
ncbi:MAG: hypothetical protein JWN93_1764 [Hyphomicrobiales bacterium]|jgi:hypothetical protein|nr:hypothetical protein [Hyphomicrobiales bacterium]